MVALYLERQECPLSDVCGFLRTQLRKGFVPNLPGCKGSVQQRMHWAKFTLDVTPWNLIEFSQRPAIPTRHPQVCFRESVMMYSALAKLHLTSGKSSREADKCSLVCVCTLVQSLRANRRPPGLDCGLGGFADLPLSQEINDFKPCSRIQNIHNTDMKYHHKLIPTDYSSCL